MMINGKPVVCLSGGSNHIDTDGAGPRFIHLRDTYTKAIARAGGVVLVGGEQTPQELMQLCDALVLCGGPDIEPEYYGESVLNDTVRCDPLRTDFELALTRAALAENKPILTICRGFQILNVVLGGTLYQDLVEQMGLHHFDTEMRHNVTAAKGSLLYDLYGERFKVNSTHHQAIKQLGKGLIPTARSDESIIEAYQHESLPIFGTQFHPERLTGELFDCVTPNFASYFEHFIKITKESVK